MILICGKIVFELSGLLCFFDKEFRNIKLEQVVNFIIIMIVKCLIIIDDKILIIYNFI